MKTEILFKVMTSVPAYMQILVLVIRTYSAIKGVRGNIITCNSLFLFGMCINMYMYAVSCCK